MSVLNNDILAIKPPLYLYSLIDFKNGVIYVTDGFLYIFLMKHVVPLHLDIADVHKKCKVELKVINFKISIKL